MAADGDESYLDLSDYDAISVIRLQAFWRGWLVWKKLKDAQTEFQQIVGELDGTAVTVEWRGLRSLSPVVVRPSRKQRAAEAKRQAENAQPTRSQMDRGVKIDCNKLVQTSFVETWSKSNDDTNTIDRASVYSDHSTKSSSGSKGRGSEVIQGQDDVERDTHRASTESASWGSKEKTVEMVSYDERKPSAEMVIDSERLHTSNKNSDRTRNSENGVNSETEMLNQSRTFESVSAAEEATSQTSHNRVPDASHSQFLVISSSDSTPTNTLTSPDPVTSSGDVQTAKSKQQRNEFSSSRSGVSPVNILSQEVEFTAGKESGGVSAPQERMPESSSRGRTTDSFFGDQTSIWDSSSSVSHVTLVKTSHKDPKMSANASEQMAGSSCDELRRLSSEDLLKQRQSVAMELLWVQQAIISRKKYLKLKNQMAIKT